MLTKENALIGRRIYSQHYGHGVIRGRYGTYGLEVEWEAFPLGRINRYRMEISSIVANNCRICSDPIDQLIEAVGTIPA